MTAADYTIIIIIVIFALIGLKTGLLKSVYRLASFIASIFLAIKLAKPVAGWFRGTGVFDGISNAVEKLLSKMNINFSEVSNPTNVESIKTAVQDLPFPDNIKTMIAEAMASGATTTADLFDQFVEKITFFILVIICAITLFIILRILFWLFGHLIKGIAEIPIIKQVDRIAGLVIGAVLGVGIVYMLCLVLTYAAAYENFEAVYNNINEGVIAPFFYNNNILAGLIGSGKEGWL
ncbi:MAG: CvpA family protein [Clostridia bacterium]|nr:CvpA family protein [Clostridia bacterium]